MKLVINGIVVQGECSDISLILEQLIYQMGETVDRGQRWVK